MPASTGTSSSSFSVLEKTHGVMDLRAKRQPLPTCEKSTIPVTYRTELAVAAAAAGNLLAAPDREGSAESFSHTNPTHGLRWTRAAFCRSAPDKALSKPARGVCLRWLDTWSGAGQLFAAREGSRGVTAPRQGRSRRPGSGRSGLRREQRARGARSPRCGHGGEPGESSGRQQSGVCPLRNQRRGRDAVFGREERVCELRLQYRLLAQALSECIPEQSYTRKSHPKPAKARKQRRKVVGKGSALFPPNRQKCCQKLWKNCQTCPCLCLGIPRKSFPRTLLRVRKWESASPEVVWFKVKKT